jgi:hypothetical protein
VRCDSEKRDYQLAYNRGAEGGDNEAADDALELGDAGVAPDSSVEARGGKDDEFYGDREEREYQDGAIAVGEVVEGTDAEPVGEHRSEGKPKRIDAYEIAISDQGIVSHQFLVRSTSKFEADGHAAG